MIKEFNRRCPQIPENKSDSLCREESYGRLDIRPFSKEREEEIRLKAIKEQEDKTPMHPDAFQWGGL